MAEAHWTLRILIAQTKAGANPFPRGYTVYRTPAQNTSAPLKNQSKNFVISITCYKSNFSTEFQFAGVVLHPCHPLGTGLGLNILLST